MIKFWQPLLLIAFMGTSIIAGGCSSSSKQLLSPEVTNERYQVDDKGEKFLIKKSTRFLAQKNQLITKQDYIAEGEEFAQKTAEEKILESSIAISNPGKMGSATVLRPEIAQHHVWFDGQRYSTEMIFNSSTQKLDIKLRSPEAKWNGNKSYPLPKGTGAFCFYSQLVECVRYTGFFEKAVDNEGGTMNLHILWDGFPYFMDQYPGIAVEPFTAATVQYDGILDKEFYRFVVEQNDQTLFLIFDKKYQIVKQLWVSQGMTLIRE